MRKLLSGIATLGFLFSLFPAVIASAGAPLHPCGCLPGSPEKIRSFQQYSTPENRLFALQTSVDLTNDFPSPGDQGQQGSCVAWAVGYADKSHQEKGQYGWAAYNTSNPYNHPAAFDSTDEFSPAYIYNQLDGGVDGGIPIGAAMDLVRDQGTCTLAEMPYNQYDYTTQPNSTQRQDASYFKAKSVSYISPSDIASMKSCLSSGNAFVLGIPVYQDFDKQNTTNNPVYDTSAIIDPNDPYLYLYQPYRGLHAICIIGYDDSLYGGSFKYINSWGTSYGHAGYGYITYNLVSGIAFEAYMMTDDSSSPTITFTYPTAPTNQNVTVSASVNNAVLSQTSHTFTDNGSFTFSATDAVGNVVSKTVTISNIDRTPPAISLTASDTWAPSNTVTANVSDSSGVYVKKYAGGLHTANYFASSGTTFTANTFSADSNDVYTVYSKDNAGNEATRFVQVFHVDQTAPASPNIANNQNRITITAGNDGGNQTQQNLNYILEKFDNNNFNFTFSGNPWSLTATRALNDVESFTNNDISDNQTTYTQFTVNTIGNESSPILSFYYDVSSEQNWDYFSVYIDGTQVLHQSGEVPWTLFQQQLSTGQHTIKFEYAKDTSVSSGLDSVFIDDLSLCYTTPGTAINEDFEDGNYNFNFSSDNTPWNYTSAKSLSGYRSFTNSDISDNGTSSSKFQITIPNNAESPLLSFYYSVSSEQNFDFLNVYDNGTRILQTSGTIPWTLFQQQLSIGQHTIKFEYSKDTSVSSGLDSAFIDDINLNYNDPTNTVKSGIKNLQYNIDGGTWQTYTGPFDAPYGNSGHYVYARAIDNAGNISTVNSLYLPDDFDFDASTGMITGYTGTDPHVVIPSKINGVTVTGIDEYAFMFNTTITSVIIPNGVTSIGSNAFHSCSSLANVTIPNSVTSIGSDAFSDTPLTSVTLPSNLRSLDNYAFYLCPLTSIAIPDGVTSIGDYAFQDCYSLRSITIPDSVTSIGSGTFTSCPADLVIYASNTSYAHTFATSHSINFVDPNSSSNNFNFNASTGMITGYTGTDPHVVIPSKINGVTVTGIGEYAFMFNTTITSVIIPNGVTSIGSNAFHSCSSLANVTIPDSVTSIGSDAFSDTQLTSVTLPSSLRSLDNYAFYLCPLTSIAIPDGVTSISDYAFMDCYSLRSITIPDSVTSIGSGTFTSCPADLVIYASNTSYAHTFAISHSINFVAI